MIIGITGQAYSGKDTAADIICDMLPMFIKISFADPMKEMLATGLGLTREQLYGSEKESLDPRYGCTPRHIMQTIGTEWGRNMIDKDIWVKAMAARSAGKNVVIADVCFEDEAEFCRQHGTLIHIKGRGGIAGNHDSESGVLQRAADFVAWNDGTIEDYRNDLKEIVADILSNFKISPPPAEPSAFDKCDRTIVYRYHGKDKRAALRGSAKRMLGKFSTTCCDDPSVNACTRCNTVFLAKTVLEMVGE